MANNIKIKICGQNNPAIINSESQGLPILMSELKKSIISGRVMAEFDIDMISADPTLDTILMDQDRIMIPHLPNQVYVYGEISNQGAIRYSPGKGVNYYLKNAGNILETGDKKTIFVVHPNGNTERLSSNFRIFNNQNNCFNKPRNFVLISNNPKYLVIIMIILNIFLT